MLEFDAITGLLLGIVIGAAFAPFWMTMWANFILPAGQWVKAKVKSKLDSKD